MLQPGAGPPKPVPDGRRTVGLPSWQGRRLPEGTGLRPDTGNTEDPGGRQDRIRTRYHCVGLALRHSAGMVPVPAGLERQAGARPYEGRCGPGQGGADGRVRPAQAVDAPGPGIAHFFVFWASSSSCFTIIEAYGDLFSQTFAIPGIGHDLWLGFLEDFFATAVLVALVTFTVIRIMQAPTARHRKSRFYGSHMTARRGWCCSSSSA